MYGVPKRALVGFSPQIKKKGSSGFFFNFNVVIDAPFVKSWDKKTMREFFGTTYVFISVIRLVRYLSCSLKEISLPIGAGK